MKTNSSKKGFPYYLNLSLGWLFLYMVVFFLIILGNIFETGISVSAEMILGIAGISVPDSDFWTTATMYLLDIGMWLAVLLALVIRKRNRPILGLLGHKMSGNNLKGFLVGAAIGGGANALIILVAWLHKDIYLYFDSFQPLRLLVLLVAMFIQSSVEEMLCRVYLHQKLMALYKNNFWLCAFLNSMLFTLLHLGNPGVTILSLINIFLAGILFNLMAHYMESVWAAFAGHMAWNYTQTILFGLPNSGVVSPYSVFKLDASKAINSFAYNVEFGVEGTLTADIVLLLCCIALYLWGRNRAGR